ncbi:hypothetical protein CR513_05982, partial [Mucuna pruriens]
MRQWRWLEYLQDFDFDLNYYLGKANVVADTLSRKSLHVSTLLSNRDLSLGCEETPKSVRLDGVVRLQDRVYVPSVPYLKKLILEEETMSSLSMHPSAMKMY